MAAADDEGKVVGCDWRGLRPWVGPQVRDMITLVPVQSECGTAEPAAKMVEAAEAGDNRRGTPWRRQSVASWR